MKIFELLINGSGLDEYYNRFQDGILFYFLSSESSIHEPSNIGINSSTSNISIISISIGIGGKYTDILIILYLLIDIRKRGKVKKLYPRTWFFTPNKDYNPFYITILAQRINRISSFLKNYNSEYKRLYLDKLIIEKLKNIKLLFIRMVEVDEYTGECINIIAWILHGKG